MGMKPFLSSFKLLNTIIFSCFSPMSHARDLITHFSLWFCSSMIWWMFPSHRKHLLLVSWAYSWTSRCIAKTMQRGKIAACIGGIDSDHLRRIREVRNSIPCLSTSTSSSPRCDRQIGVLQWTESSGRTVSQKCVHHTREDRKSVV